jgi:YesN/AraC family two-component response regulator
LVITDMTMPHMNGGELIQRIRAIRPDIPVILCSGFSDLIDKEKALALGIQRYLTKPVAKRELLTAVREVLDENELSSI